jgi:hypothetical protein
MKNYHLREELAKGTKHKYYCLQISKDDSFWRIMHAALYIHRKCDHAGFSFVSNFLWFSFYFQKYDNRHWCDKCKSYMNNQCYEENHNNYPILSSR